MILVTGAAGKTGRAVIRALVAKGAPVRAMVRRSDQVDILKALGAKEIYVGDLRRMEAVESAVQQTQAIYHICPNIHPDEREIGENLIFAACSSGVGYFVYHSVLHPQSENMPHHWLKMRVEERLFESGLSFTILQPAAYMQNLLVNWNMICEEGIFQQPYSAESRLSLVDLEDVAEAATIVLTETGHKCATYELAGTEPLSQIEVAFILSEQLGRQVRFERLTLDQWKNSARSTNLDLYQVDTLVKMFEYYDHYGLSGNTNVLGWLLDRQPTNLVEFVKRIAKERDN